MGGARGRDGYLSVLLGAGVVVMVMAVVVLIEMFAASREREKD